MLDFDSTERELHSQLGEPDADRHPSLALLRAAGQDVLPATVDARIRAHVGKCRVCTMLLSDFATLPEVPFSAIQQQRVAATLPTNTSRTLVNSRPTLIAVLGAAAALLILCAGIFFFARKGPLQAAQVSAPAAPPSVSIATLEIPLTPLPPPADATLALQTRGAAAGEPSVEVLLPAFQAYNRGDFSKAEQRFVPLLTTYPRSKIVPLYLGVSRLYLGKNQQAYDALASAQKSSRPDQLATAQWYAAIAAQRLHRSEALSLLESVCSQPASTHSAESCHLAATLH